VVPQVLTGHRPFPFPVNTSRPWRETRLKPSTDGTNGELLVRLGPAGDAFGGVACNPTGHRRADPGLEPQHAS